MMTDEQRLAGLNKQLAECSAKFISTPAANAMLVAKRMKMLRSERTYLLKKMQFVAVTGW